MRVVVQLARSGFRFVRSVESGPPGAWKSAFERYRDLVYGDDSDDVELSTLMTAYSGTTVQVATYSGTFELRKVQFIWSENDQATPKDDARVATFHLIKLSGGVPTDTWVAGDFTALDSAFTTWWGNIKSQFCSQVTWDRIKVYKAGPAIVPPQPPVYDADKNVIATGATNAALPPQSAVSVTEIAGSKRYWGRFYLPPPDSGKLSTYGRLDTTAQTAIADHTDTLYTALKTANLEPVVYRAALPERETKAGTTLPARNASAWTVEKIQVDDVMDVIRRRRWKYPTLKLQRDI